MRNIQTQEDSLYYCTNLNKLSDKPIRYLFFELDQMIGNVDRDIKLE